MPIMNIRINRLGHNMGLDIDRSKIIHLDGEGAGAWNLYGLEGGMQSGQHSVMLHLELPDGRHVFAENSMKNFQMAYSAFMGAFSFEAKKLITPMILYCPKCGLQHIDVNEWATKTHTIHRCEGCFNEWQPALIPTVGVEDLESFKV